MDEEVPEDTIVVYGTGGHWVVRPHNQPVERFDRRVDAILKANEISLERPTRLTIIIKPAPGPFYE